MEDQFFPNDSTMVTVSALTAIQRSLYPVMEDEDVFLSSDDEYSSDGGVGRSVARMVARFLALVLVVMTLTVGGSGGGSGGGGGEGNRG
jgi:hypothetical protein